MKTNQLALAAAILAVASVFSSAQASVVVFNVSPAQTVVNNSEITFGKINLTNGTFALNDPTSPSFGIGINTLTNFYSQSNIGVEWALDAPGGYIQKLSANDTISSAITNWSSSDPYFSNASSGPWISGGNAYAGLRLDAGSGNYNYGWVSINYDSSAHTAAISQFAFENTPNTSVSAGAVPEPSTWALLGLGGLTLVSQALRRR